MDTILQMAKKRKKLTRKQEEEKEDEDLLEYFSKSPYVIIYGRKILRIRYDGNNGSHCPGCHVETGSLHWICCEFEICGHCKGLSLNCLCDPDVNNAERDNFVECLEEII